MIGDIVLPDDPALGPEVQVDYPGYLSTQWRAPRRLLASIPEELHSLAGPVFGEGVFEEWDNDLTRRHAGEPLGERIIVHGRLLGDDGRPIPDALIEVWQANAAGRYLHDVDVHPAPLDANFSGAGRVLTDDAGRYRFTTIKPGAYPWRNHDNAWRPAHVHFSIFGWCFRTRLITQMYFPDDPLFPYDPVLQALHDERARQRLISRFDLALTTPEWALGYRFDIVVRGNAATPFEGRI